MRFSIVTISFNQARFLEECIDSIAGQRWPRLDYIMVDAGSTDGSRAIIERNRGRFAHCIMEPDQGPADGLNKGFALAQGEVFGYLNSDDRFAPHAFEYVADFFMRNPEVDVLLGACRLIDERGRPRLRKRISSRFTLERFLTGTILALQQATFFRRRAWEMIAGFNVENRTCWDSELLVDMAMAGARIQTEWKLLGDFRIYPQSLTGSGCLKGAVDVDLRRMAAKVRTHGVVSAPAPLREVAWLCYRLNPIRRAMEFMVR